MSDVSKRRLRMHVLASATAIAIASMSALPAIAAGRVDASGLQSPGQTGFDRFIVKYKEGSSERASTSSLATALTSATRAIPAKSGRVLQVTQVRRLAVGADVVRADRKLDRVEAESLMRQLANNPNVEYVEVDKLNKALFTPNDTNFSQQYGFGTGAGGIRATEAWDITSGAGTVVAVLDTGITNHSDLAANILPGYDFIIDTAVSVDGNGRDSDPSDPGDAYGGNPSSWHGTHVAGTIAAVTNNGKGVAGTAFSAKVVPVRVLGAGGGYDSDIADAIIWASGGTVSGVPANANPAEVINLSLGGSGACGTTTQTAINGAVSRGTTLVIAAGNDNGNVSNASPANCNNVVAVGAVTSTGARASYSNYGTLVDVAAPGSAVLSTLNAGTAGPGAESYASYSGTSMATPHVAGVVALIQSVSNPAKTPAQIEALLKSSARAFPSTPSQPIGTGIVNAKAAVDAAGGGGGTNAAPVANFTSSASGLTATFSDSSTDSDGTIASRSWNFGDGTTSTATSPSKTYSAAGTYNVSLTVTDDDGATNTKTSAVTVSAGGGGGTVLQNGVAVTGLAAAAGASLNYTMAVPAGATGLKFVTSGGTGDSDMYVKFGSAPTDTSYDCRPYASGNAETCNIATASAGTYYVRLKAYSAFSGLSLTGSYTAGGGGGSTQTYTNGTDVTIGDNTTVNSPITVSGRSGNGLASTSVAVNIVHTYKGDLKVDLVAPDGSVYVLHNRTGGSTDNINSTFTVNLSSEVLNGTWNLRVNDNASGDTGYINSWSVTF
ncbi:PKD domain-containing protein [Pseudoxanthomonas gei]|uniref:PKD domain-containing protein n=1 Tax=Pseudoxanthomonas gei TaxID=1383030 RepID=A0ABX0AEV2_9GAMM|nr:PKD domain-containing protein [Pseudoxanthomonas gei]